MDIIICSKVIINEAEPHIDFNFVLSFSLSSSSSSSSFPLSCLKDTIAGLGWAGVHIGGRHVPNVCASTQTFNWFQFSFRARRSANTRHCHAPLFNSITKFWWHVPFGPGRQPGVTGMMPSISDRFASQLFVLCHASNVHSSQTTNKAYPNGI